MSSTGTRRLLVAGIVWLTLSGACAGAGDRGSSTVESSTTTVSCRSSASGPVTYQYVERPGTDPDRVSLDLYIPAGCGAVPVVVWVHGGGWRTGDKDAGQIERKVEWAESIGVALAAVNYRLSTPDSGVVWPDHGEDVAAAVAWIQREGPSLGLDTDRMVLLGHSAGAHLVAIVGTDPTLLTTAGGDPGRISCVIPLDFSFDLETAPARALIANAFGDDPAVLEDASPNIQIERNGAPGAKFLVGTRGGRTRVAEAQQFVDLINVSGGEAVLLDANPYSHDQISSQLGAPGEEIMTPVVSAFVRSCFAASAS